MTGRRRHPGWRLIALGPVLLTPALGLAPSGPAGAAGADTLPAAPGCPVLPADDVWHTPVNHLPVDPRSATYVASIGESAPLHPDFGSGTYQGEPIGIPFTVVGGNQPEVPVRFRYAAESDPGPYPIPANAPIEGGPASTGDRHVLVVDRATCRDYELWDAAPHSGGAWWSAGSGSVFTLTSNGLRPAGWTSADAAGLPILPGLVRPAEIRAGVIDHAIRVTVPRTDSRFVWPARHQAGVDDPSLPPMGLRLLLGAGVAIGGFPRTDRIILRALQTYGMIVADNGSPWYLSGVPSPKWNNDVLHQLSRIPGSDFEVVDESCLKVAPSSAAADPSRCPSTG